MNKRLFAWLLVLGIPIGIPSEATAQGLRFVRGDCVQVDTLAAETKQWLNSLPYASVNESVASGWESSLSQVDAVIVVAGATREQLGRMQTRPIGLIAELAYRIAEYRRPNSAESKKKREQAIAAWTREIQDGSVNSFAYASGLIESHVVNHSNEFLGTLKNEKVEQNCNPYYLKLKGDLHWELDNQSEAAYSYWRYLRIQGTQVLEDYPDLATRLYALGEREKAVSALLKVESPPVQVMIARLYLGQISRLEGSQTEFDRWKKRALEADTSKGNWTQGLEDGWYGDIIMKMRFEGPDDNWFLRRIDRPTWDYELEYGLLGSPRHYETHRELVDRFVLAGKMARASELAQRAFVLMPDTVATVLLLAEVERRRGNVQAAKRWYDFADAAFDLPPALSHSDDQSAFRPRVVHMQKGTGSFVRAWIEFLFSSDALKYRYLLGNHEGNEHSARQALDSPVILPMDFDCQQIRYRTMDFDGEDSKGLQLPWLIPIPGTPFEEAFNLVCELE